MTILSSLSPPRLGSSNETKSSTSSPSSNHNLESTGNVPPAGNATQQLIDDQQPPTIAFGADLLANNVNSWKVLRARSIATAEKAAQVEGTLGVIVDKLEAKHASYAALQRQLDTLPAMNASLERLMDVVSEVSEKVSRLEIVLDLVVKQRDALAIVEEHANAQRQVDVLKDKLAREYLEGKRTVEEKRLKQVEKVLRDRRSSAEREIKAAIGQIARKTAVETVPLSSPTSPTSSSPSTSSLQSPPLSTKVTIETPGENDTTKGSLSSGHDGSRMKQEGTSVKSSVITPTTKESGKPIETQHHGETEQDLP